MSSLNEIAGKPREGVHAIRLFDIAVVDVIGTGVGAYALSKLTGWGFGTSFIGLFAIGQGFHYYFKVDSKFMETMGVEFDESDDIHLSKCPFAL